MISIRSSADMARAFLAKAVQLIADRVKARAPGKWSGYVEQDLLPRLHGFELLMASYAMCHMKLDMQLTESGYKPSGNPPRLSVWLTNALEPAADQPHAPQMFMELVHEAEGADDVKRQAPIMCVIGNPPYNIMSGNLSDAQIALIQPYRSVAGEAIIEKGMLQFEKNINNDYIKFIAFAEKAITRNGCGIVGFITSHGYLKSGSFRGLRHHLLQTFDEIRILDLHGNSEIREVAPKDIIDKNVFDIKQGVCIIVGVRRSSAKHESLARIGYLELWGSRDAKNVALHQSDAARLEWQTFEPQKPNWTFHPFATAGLAYSSEFISVSNVFPLYSSGVITARDDFVISESTRTLERNALEFAGNKQLSDDQLCRQLGIAIKKGWDIGRARKRLQSLGDPTALIKDIAYRPFDNRKILYDDSLVWTTARSTMSHMLAGQNLMLVSARSEKSGTCSHFYISTFLVETKCGERTTQSAVFPLYLYAEDDPRQKDAFALQHRTPNLDPTLYGAICLAAGIDPADQAGPDDDVRAPTGAARPSEVKVFDYIYGVLHAPNYRATFAEFLKIDFPRIPCPPSPEVFTQVSDKGEQLRRLHLMERAAIGDTPYPYHGDGDDVVASGYPKFDAGRVLINPDQYFDAISPVAWGFHIGGYQPAQKWLKDRRGRPLSYDEIGHYQRIVKILTETDRIMHEIQLPLSS